MEIEPTLVAYPAAARTQPRMALLTIVNTAPVFARARPPRFIRPPRLRSKGFHVKVAPTPRPFPVYLEVLPQTHPEIRADRFHHWRFKLFTGQHRHLVHLAEVQVAVVWRQR